MSFVPKGLDTPELLSGFEDVFADNLVRIEPTLKSQSPGYSGQTGLVKDFERLVRTGTPKRKREVADDTASVRSKRSCLDIMDEQAAPSYAMAVQVNKVTIVHHEHPSDLLDLEAAKKIVKQIEDLVELEPESGVSIHFAFVKPFDGYVLVGYADDATYDWLEDKI